MGEKPEETGKASKKVKYTKSKKLERALEAHAALEAAPGTRNKKEASGILRSGHPSRELRRARTLAKHNADINGSPSHPTV